MSVREVTEDTVVGEDPRAEALQLLDAAWVETLRLDDGACAEPLLNMQVDAAKVAALVYVGDQIKGLRADMRERDRRGAQR